jgi:colicin import membrane protein
MTERDLAMALARGELKAPVRVPGSNAFLVPLRFTGTGAAARPALGEIAWREPSVWLSGDMAQQICGTLVIADHPPGDGLANLDYVRANVLGSIIFGYVLGSELWCIARTLSKDIAEAIADPQGYSIDTSPMVNFAPGGTASITLDSGDTLLCEGTPASIDHLAVLISPRRGPGAGVWSKGAEASGADPDKATMEVEENV